MSTGAGPALKRARKPRKSKAAVAVVEVLAEATAPSEALDTAPLASADDPRVSMERAVALPRPEGEADLAPESVAQQAIPAEAAVPAAPQSAQDTSLVPALRAVPAPRLRALEPLGSWLRRERELRAVALEEVSDSTRIPVPSLVHLEAGRYGELPGDVFVRGFLRSYARVVGLSQDDALARYSAEQRARDVKPVLLRVVDPSAPKGRRFGLAIALVVFGILATLAASFLLRPRNQDRPEQLSGLAETASPVA
jgi:hypothetical protein